MTRRLHLLTTGGPHQLAHVLPVACELHRRQGTAVTIFADRADTVAEARRLADRIGLPLPPLVEMNLPPAMALLPRRLHKLSGLLAWANRLRDADALLCAERTTTILKRLPGHCPPMIHIPHGAGDRAKGFEPRIRLFDLVLTAGEKDRERMIAEGVTQADRSLAIGGIKMAAMARIGLERPALFDNPRPVVLYNPHFDRRLGSFEQFAERLIAFVLADGRYNLVLAPHIRLAEHWNDKRRALWESRSVPDRIIVDLGSDRSFDMSYPLAADIYIGDVSSQVYEFLVRPRPCLFIDSHDAAWQGNPDYAMWSFGPVIRPDADLASAIDAAFAGQSEFAAIQHESVVRALGRHPWLTDSAASDDAIVCGAGAIENFLNCNFQTGGATSGGASV